MAGRRKRSVGRAHGLAARAVSGGGCAIRGSVRLTGELAAQRVRLVGADARTPKLALLLAEALPEPEPLRPRVFPAAVAEVTLFTAPVTVPARPTLPFADPLCELTERLAEPLADPLTRPLTLLVIEAGPCHTIDRVADVADVVQRAAERASAAQRSADACR